MPTLTLTLQTRIGLARAGHLANLRCTSDDGVVGGDDDVVRGPDLCNWARRVPLTLKASRRGRAHCCSHAAPRPERIIGTVRHVPRIAPLLQLPMAPEQTIVLQRFFGDLHYSVGPASCPPAVVVPRF